MYRMCIAVVLVKEHNTFKHWCRHSERWCHFKTNQFKLHSNTNLHKIGDTYQVALCIEEGHNQGVFYAIISFNNRMLATCAFEVSPFIYIYMRYILLIHLWEYVWYWTTLWFITITYYVTPTRASTIGLRLIFFISESPHGAIRVKTNL